MNSKEFNKIVERRCKLIQSTLVLKAKEYARDDNRLHNFDRGSEISGETRERVLHGFLLKHLISYFDMLDKIDAGKLPTYAVLDEKITDIINYFILFEASVKNKLANK